MRARAGRRRGVAGARRALALLVGAVILVAGIAEAGAAPDHACVIQPWDVVAVASAIEGRIETVTVDRGDLVKRGQVLVTLDASVERAAVAAATARTEVESARKSARVRIDFGIRRLQRTEEMYKKDLVPLKDLDEAETAKLLADLSLEEAEENRRIAQLDLDRARAVLALKTIRSPFDGVVLERLLSPGEAAGASPILRLARLDPLRVEAFLPVVLQGAVRPGATARVLPEVGGEYPATVAVTDRIADPASGTFGVRLELPNPGYRLPAGIRCQVRFSP